MASVHFKGVTKEFEGGTLALKDLDLDVDDGEFVVLVGPSGSGKSTALRILAGLEESTAGSVLIGDRVVDDVPPKDRDIAMVFQNYALYPHMSVDRNMSFALKLRGERPDSIRARVREVAARLTIGDLLARLPRQLSGGQRQRVALGRAIVREPQVFLMDEPLSNLDAQLRVEMRAYIARLRQELGTTTLYVTHDQVEAMTMGDRVAVMRDGRLEQVAPPQELYDRPANLFVGAFIGSPAMNLIEGRLLAGEARGQPTVGLGAQHLDLPEALLAKRPGLREYFGRDVVVGLRPEIFGGVNGEGPGGRTLSAPVQLVEALGSDVLVHLELDAREAVARAPDDPTRDTARLTVRLEPAQRPRTGDEQRLFVDVERLHFFDPEGGRAIA